MEVSITTSQPSEIDPLEIAGALEHAGYYVARVEVLDRANILHTVWEARD